MTYDGKVYGLPLTKFVGMLFCNTDYFEKYNVEYPETWDQLITAIKTFRANGITPMSLGGKDAWAIGMLHNALAIRTAGADRPSGTLASASPADAVALRHASGC
jgi:raffinose/stachyose/melibiose transport system substrate-binding protein